MGTKHGQKKRFTLEQVARIRHMLIEEQNQRDRALLDVSISTMLRSVDLLNLRIRDVIDHRGKFAQEFKVIQQKTGQPVVCQLGSHARKGLAWLTASYEKQPDDYIFTHENPKIKRRLQRVTWSIIIKKWAYELGLDPELYSTHSMRRTRAAHVYRETQDIETVRILLGQTSLAAPQRYLGVDEAQALEKGRKWEM